VQRIVPRGEPLLASSGLGPMAAASRLPQRCSGGLYNTRSAPGYRTGGVLCCTCKLRAMPRASLFVRPTACCLWWNDHNWWEDPTGQRPAGSLAEVRVLLALT